MARDDLERESRRASGDRAFGGHLGADADEEANACEEQPLLREQVHTSGMPALQLPLQTPKLTFFFAAMS